MSSNMWTQRVSVVLMYLGWRILDRLTSLVTGRKPNFIPEPAHPPRRVIPRPAKYRHQPILIRQATEERTACYRN